MKALSIALATVCIATVYTLPLPAAKPEVRTAAFEPTAVDDGRQQVQFARRAASVGDEIEQQIVLEMRLATSIRQGNELIEKNHTELRSSQRRIVSTTHVENERSMGVVVQYVEAKKQLVSNDAASAPAAISQPVEGKTYHCRRSPADNKQLMITYPDGKTPPPEEHEIVAESMEMVGQVNPLAQFLTGRTISVGETIQLPQEIADQVFNLGNSFGQVTQFDLKLERLESRNELPCAVFSAHVEAASNRSSQMRMQMEGPLVVEIESCRALQLSLSGPIGISETRGSYSTVHQLIGTGRLNTSIASTYRDAVR